jgi:phytoene dehydrogenase-like protein
MKPIVDAPDLATTKERLLALWEMRGAIGSLVHFRKPVGQWAREHIVDDRLRRLLTAAVPETAPAFFLMMILGFLERGYLSRPVGGTAAFRAAVERRFRGLGGEVFLHNTVDEVLVESDRARGVRLTDGTIIDADVVLSTSSMPETALRLLGGRYDAAVVRKRLDEWKLFDPIVLVTFGVEGRYDGVPSTLYVDGQPNFEIGGSNNDHLLIRVFNDDPAMAPEGHTVVQTLLKTDYNWWATRGAEYAAEKDNVADIAMTQMEPYLPELRTRARIVDVATPLTYWTMARSWRGAFEGWMPNAESFFSHVSNKLAGLEAFYMAGQWVTPGGGIPTAVMSGRQAIQLMCADQGRPFVAPA